MRVAVWAADASSKDPNWPDWMSEPVLLDATSQPDTQAASAPATQPAAVPSLWPPGLLMDGLDAVGAKSPLDALGLRVWGYVEASFTGNLTNGQRTLFGRSFDSAR